MEQSFKASAEKARNFIDAPYLGLNTTVSRAKSGAVTKFLMAGARTLLMQCQLALADYLPKTEFQRGFMLPGSGAIRFNATQDENL